MTARDALDGREHMDAQNAERMQALGAAQWVALDAGQIVAELPPALRQIWHPRVVATTLSTHTDMADAARDGLPAGSVLLAEAQTAGRGRAGRRWITPAGSQVALSLIWRLDSPPPDGLPGLSLVTGLAAVECLQQMGLNGVALKWPNDVYWNERKLGGILVEVQGNPAARCALVVSIGINVTTCASATAVCEVDQPIVDCLTVLGIVPDRNRMAALFLSAWYGALQRFMASGFASFVDEWSRYDYLHGRAVEMQVAGRVVAGRAAGVDATGALQVQTANGIQACYAGDVQLCRARCRLSEGGTSDAGTSDAGTSDAGTPDGENG